MPTPPVADTWPDLPPRVPERTLRTWGPGVRGGSSTVFDVFGHDDTVLYKKYAIPRAEEDLDRLVQLYRGLDDDSAALVRRRYAWPLAVVAGADGAVAGVLVPRAGMAYQAHLSTKKVRVRDLNYLLYEARAARVGIEPASLREKLKLIRALVEALRWLETRGLVHEDLAAHNLLWTLRPQPAVLLLDCDSIRPVDSVVEEPLLTSTDWTDPRVLTGDTPRPDHASTVYAVGLITARVLVAPSWRPSGADTDDPLGGQVPAALAPLIRASVRASGSRPRLSQWLTTLDAVIEAMTGEGPELQTTPSVSPVESLPRTAWTYALKGRLAVTVGFVIGAVAAVVLLTGLL
ncbi:protein kinase family protein [Micromonospora coxensis]|uniref:Protein kinase domain-containing protein n=1 Tax=Micromonospora coxensis TaxID=356852 RepID=A0A1C5GTA8_9ACTN|nr:hypothetical protein [Micromonospora coxensis]SCG37032.1 hypothetical protein GA0070614_0351 [Micromonospora coxensis]